MMYCIDQCISLVGWCAKDPNILRRVGHILLQLPFAPQRNPRQIFIADDCFQLSRIPRDRVVEVVIKSTEKLFGSMSFINSSLFENLKEILLFFFIYSSEWRNIPNFPSLL